MTTVACMLSSGEVSARPWGWLPDEKATTPAARSSGESALSRLYAPRNLKAPPRCRFSHLKKTSALVRLLIVREVTTGVRFATPSSRAAALRTSSSEIANSAVTVVSDGETRGSLSVDVERLRGTTMIGSATSEDTRLPMGPLCGGEDLTVVPCGGGR